MSDTLILRFRDFEADTIAAHQEIIRMQGAVWWAWWKKESEEGHLAALVMLRDRLPVQIGLINRQSDRRFLATCSRLALGNGEARILSPEPDRTPTYYRDGAFPAWFLITEITELSPDEWDRRFGAVPIGEPTLFVIPEDQPAMARKALSDRLKRIPLPIHSGIILHISDLHFGSDYGFPLVSRSVPTGRTTLDQTLVQGLSDMGVGQVGLVIVSGDLTTRGDGYTDAQVFLERLLRGLGLTSDQLVIVPGNHDIELDDTKATRSYSAEQPFRNFLTLLQGDRNRGQLELNELMLFSINGGGHIIVLALNSVRPRTVETMDYGYVGRDLYGPLVKEASELRVQLRDTEGRSPLCVAVLHHHVLPTPLVENPEEKRAVSLTLDAGQLIEDLQRADFDLILHGHQHVPFIGSTARLLRPNADRDWVLKRPIHVLGGGSCGVKVERLWDTMRENSVGIYSLGADELGVRVFRFAPGTEFSTHITLTLPLTS